MSALVSSAPDAPSSTWDLILVRTSDVFKHWWRTLCAIPLSSNQAVWTTVAALLGVGTYRVARDWWRQYIRDMTALLQPMPIVVTLRHPVPALFTGIDQATNTSPEPSPTPSPSREEAARAPRETRSVGVMTAEYGSVAPAVDAVSLSDLHAPRPHTRVPFFLCMGNDMPSPSPTLTPPPSREASVDTASLPESFEHISRPASAPAGNSAASHTAAVAAPWFQFFRGQVEPPPTTSLLPSTSTHASTLPPSNTPPDTDTQCK